MNFNRQEIELVLGLLTDDIMEAFLHDDFFTPEEYSLRYGLLSKLEDALGM